MAIFRFNPFMGIGQISFGENRNEVRNDLGEYSEFKKNKFSKNTTDKFGSINVYYDENNLVIAVECFRDTIVTYQNKNLFLLDKEGIIGLFNDPTAKIEGNTIILQSMGIEVNFTDNKVDNIFVYSRNYETELCLHCKLQSKNDPL